MLKQKGNRLLSILLCAVMLLPGFVTAFSFETQAASNVNITIADVTRHYQETVTLLNLCNDYRSKHDLPEWKMDAQLSTIAWERAVELVVYPSLTPPGSSGYSSLGTSSGQILGIDVFNLSTLINYDSNNPTYYQTLNSSDLNAVGIGIVVVRGKKYVALIAADKDVTAVDSSVLSQADQTVNQTISVSTAILSSVISLNFASQESFYCGDEWTIQFMTTNSQGGKAWLTPDCATLTSSAQDVFKPGSNCTIVGQKEGKSTITLKLKANTSITASAEYIAVTKTFDDCDMSSIPDQVYTGSAITPDVTIEDVWTGDKLVKGKDYTLSYSNNVNVGTAKVTITGINAYVGQTSQTTFRIVSNPDLFKVSLSLGSSTVYAGESVKATASVIGGTGTIQYKFEAGGTQLQSGTSTTCTYKSTAAGTVTIKVTATDSAGKTASATASLTVKAALKSAITLSAASITIGSSVTIKASGSGGSGTYKYAYDVIIPNSTSWGVISSASANASLTYKPTATGTYQFRVTVTDDAGHSASSTSSLTVQAQQALTNNSKVSAESIAFGNKITITGAASGGTSPYKYAFYYKKSSSSTWTTIGTAYDSSTSQTFTPAASTTYEVKVIVKDNASKTAEKTFTITVTKALALTNNSTVVPTSATVGAAVTLKGAASGGTAPYTYAYYYKKSTSNSWTKIGTEYTSTTSTTFKPGSAASYNVKISVKDVTGTVVTKTFTVTAAVAATLVNNSTISTTSVSAGTAVTLKGAASGGTSPYKYAFYYKKSSSSTWTKIGTEYGTAVSGVFTPGTAATYNAKVIVKDNAGKTATKTFNVTATSALTNKSSVSTLTVPAGTSVTLKGAASGGTTPYSYAYYYRKSTTSSWTTIGTAYGTATSATFTPASSGEYIARISVKDKAGTVVSNSYTVTVTEAIVNSSTISSLTVKSGNSVTMKGAASGGTSPYKYAFYYKKSTSSTWTTIGTAFGSATSGSFTPGSVAVYDAKVTVKDKNGFTKDKTFTVTVKAADPLVNSSSVSTPNTYVGSSVTMKGAASGGTSPYTYAFYYKKSTSSTWTTIGTAFGSATSATFTPGSVATYNIKITVKDKSGTTTDKTFTLASVALPSLTNKSTVSATSVAAGVSVTLKGAAANGTSPYTYAFYYKKSTSAAWTRIGTEFGTATSATFTPATAAEYNAKVIVKDSTGATATKTFTVKAS